jgi:heptosyltransferase II
LLKILVIQTASIGDVILATPVMEKLHSSYPDAEISLLVKKGMEGLFAGHPFLHELIAWDKSRKYADYFRILKKIRATKFDAVINIQRFALTGLLTGLSGSPLRIGFDKNPFSFLFTKKIKHEIGSGLHEVNRNLRLIEHLTDGMLTKPKLYPSEKDFASVQQYKNGRYLTISPASLWFTKQFPEEKWVEFIKTHPLGPPLLGREGEVANPQDDGWLIYLLGSKADRELCDRIVKNAGNKNCISLAGELTFLQSAALMKDAVMNYTNDSAPMHLCSAVNAPVTVVYCSTVPSFGFGPLSDSSFIVETKENLACRPCGLHGFRACPERHFNCAKMIPVEDLSCSLHHYPDSYRDKDTK